MVRRRPSLKETTSTFMLNLQNHRQCPAGGFLLWEVGRHLARLQDSLKAGSGIRGSGRRRGLARRFRKSKARCCGSPAGGGLSFAKLQTRVLVQSLQAQGLSPGRRTASPQHHSASKKGRHLATLWRLYLYVAVRERILFIFPSE